MSVLKSGPQDNSKTVQASLMEFDDVNRWQFADYARHFFRCHIKIVVAMLTDLVKMLQKHMPDPEITQKLFELADETWYVNRLCMSFFFAKCLQYPNR